MSDYGVIVKVAVKGQQVSDTKGIGKFYGSDGSVYEVEYNRKVILGSSFYEYNSQRKIK